MDNDEYFGRTGEDDRAPEPEAADLSALTLGVKLGEDHERAESGAHLTLAAIEQLTGISYVTLQRYAQQFGDRLANVYDGTGRNRRYYPAAVKEFRKIKAEMSERKAARGGVKRGTPAKPTRAVRSKPKKRNKSKPKPPRKAAAGLIPSKLTETAPRSGFRSGSIGTPKEFSEAATATASSDLDRLARIYQLRLQLKTLDGVLAFVTDWRTKVEAEIADLEKLT